MKTHSRRLVVIPRPSKSPCFHAAAIIFFFLSVFFLNGREENKTTSTTPSSQSAIQWFAELSAEEGQAV